MFAVHEPGQAVEILYCRGRLVVVPPKPQLRDLGRERAGAASGSQRSAFFPGVGRVDAEIAEGGRAGARRPDHGPGADRRADDDRGRAARAAALTVTSLGNYLVEIE